jgi:secernin
MCDTMVVSPAYSQTNSMLFAKNSDRDPNEAQSLNFFPASDHLQPSTLKCTYIEIPQAAHTFAVLLSKPFWIWGAEMGTNEKGVVIGNEAVFTRIPYEKTPGLIGMDLLRLGLERAATAIEALHLITDLIEQYGQSGNCGFAHPFQYHNSFIIADPTEAWVLETAGRDWAAEKVQSIRSISNCLTIENHFDLISDGLIKKAVERGWCKNDADFNFQRCYSDFLYTTFSDARHRQSCTINGLAKTTEKHSVESLMRILMNHDGDKDNGWSPDRRIHGADVCMHVGFGPIRINQTTGSMVSELSNRQPTHWMTGTAAPCLGVFKPVWMDSGLPDLGPEPTGKFDPATLWWEHEVLHRNVTLDYAHRRPGFIQKRNELQENMLQAVMHSSDLSVPDRLSASESCFDQARAGTREWTKLIQDIPISKKAVPYYLSAWKKINQEAEFPIK